MEIVHSSGSGADWSLSPKYCWSGIYKDWEDDRGWKWVDAKSVPFDPLYPERFRRFNHDSPKHDQYYYPGNWWDYYICKIVPGNMSSSDCVEVWFWTGGLDPATGEIFPPSVAVEDSEGNWYYPTLTLE